MNTSFQTMKQRWVTKTSGIAEGGVAILWNGVSFGQVYACCNNTQLVNNRTKVNVIVIVCNDYVNNQQEL